MSTFADYQTRALETETPIFDILTWLGVEPITPDESLTCRKIRLIHASLGMSSDLFELNDAKNQSHQREELGDVFWYANLAVDALNLSFENLMAPIMEEFANGSPRVFALIQTGRERVADMRADIERGLGEAISLFEDRVKAYVFYCSPDVKPLDGSAFKQPAEFVLLELLRRIFFYLVAYTQFLADSQVEAVLEANIRKLAERHKNKKPAQAATERDKAAEYLAMGEDPANAQS